MSKNSMLKDATSQKPVVKDTPIFERLTINVDLWNTLTVILLLMTTFWHIKNIAGWWNGQTLVQVYGIDGVLASAIAACPNILFYATHLSMALSIGMLIYTLVLFGLYLFDFKDACEVLSPVMLCTIISVWAFPLFHVINDLVATAFGVRDTLDFDVFQLGLEVGPLLVITVVCFVIMQVNKRVNTMI